MKQKVIIEFDINALDQDFWRKCVDENFKEISGVLSIKWIEPEKCPYSLIRLWYNDSFKGHAVAQISSKGLKSGSQRAKKLKARWNDYNTLEWWKEYFKYCTESKFLMGQVPPRDGFRQFRLDIDYLINEANLNMIMEGKYHGK